ncbi:MAG: hypothetical protein ICV72_02670 [Aldersonia sp.]|nr:hypothetical protein [Aldersonia sp.]
MSTDRSTEDSSLTDTGQITVAELLERNGRRPGSASGGRRRRGASGGISVAELTGEIPKVRDDDAPRRSRLDEPDEAAQNEAAAVAEAVAPPEPEAPPKSQPTPEPQTIEPAGNGRADHDSEADSDGAAQAWSASVREPELISGSTVAGDLLRRASDTARPESTKTPETEDERPAAEADAPAEQPAESSDTNQPAEGTEPSPARQWLALAGEAGVALVAGALLFKGFERLWDMLPWVALVLAVLVILSLVALVRVVRKTDDILSIVIAIVVGLFVTIGPLAFLLSAG